MGGMIGGPVRTRQDVWGLSAIDPWHSTIEWYEYAFHVLRDTTDFSDPRSLEAIANIHGTNRDPGDVAGRRRPEHLECVPALQLVLPALASDVPALLRDDPARDHRRRAGPVRLGPPVLELRPRDPATLALPPAFLQPLRPDGADNALYTPARADSILQGNGVPDTDVELTGWPDTFTASSIFVPTFGGPMTGWSHFGNAIGRVEREPHGTVHVAVGGDSGFMSAFETAGWDPIFWLHHANIDRLWEVWRNMPGHGDPQDNDWQAAGFDFGFGNDLRTLAVTDIVDTTTSPLEYVYEGVPAFVPPAPGGGFALGRRRAAGQPVEPTARRRDGRPGARSAPIPRDVVVGVDAGGGLGLDAGLPEHVYVVLQNMRATIARNRTYTVHVGVPQGEDPAAHPDLLAGRFSTFGVVGATQAEGQDPGGGLTVSFDVTEIAKALDAQGGWEPGSLRVTVTPGAACGSGEGARARRDRRPPDRPDRRVLRLMLLAGATRVPARGASLAAVRRRVGATPRGGCTRSRPWRWVPLIAGPRASDDRRRCRGAGRASSSRRP